MYVPRNFREKIFRKSGLKMLFIHTPKCGGSAVGAAFGRSFRTCISVRSKHLKGHLTWVEYESRLADLGLDIKDFVTFSVIRNPFDWHVSFFNYIRRQKPHRSGYPIEHELFQTFSFADYVDWLGDFDQPRTPRHDMGRNLSDYTCDAGGRIAVNKVLRQETLSADLAELRAQYNLLIDLPEKPVNSFSEGENYKSYYSPKEVDAIAHKHAHDLALFGYAFETSGTS